MASTESSGERKGHRFEFRTDFSFQRIRPVDLTVGTLSPDTNTPIPTVTDNLFSQGTIPVDEVAVSFEPTTTGSERNGELTFGGTDPIKFTGSITWM